MSGRIRRIPGTSIGMPAELLPNQPPVPEVGQLETVNDWKREVGNLYRAMRRKQLDVKDGTAMAYVATVGANLAKIEEEIRQRDEITAALDRQAQPANGHTVDETPQNETGVQTDVQIERDSQLLCQDKSHE